MELSKDEMGRGEKLFNMIDIDGRCAGSTHRSTPDALHAVLSPPDCMVVLSTLMPCTPRSPPDSLHAVLSPPDCMVVLSTPDALHTPLHP